MNEKEFVFVRYVHKDGFRCGEWAKVLDIRMVKPPGEGEGNRARPCLLVEFGDGFHDSFALSDLIEGRIEAATDGQVCNAFISKDQRLHSRCVIYPKGATG